MGGLLVDPDHNLHYIEGSSTWAGVMPMAIVGIGRAYGISFSQYLSANGNAVVAAMQNDNINEAEDDYSGITWSDLAAAQYPEPEDVPPFVTIANRLILGSAGMPKVPEFIAQGTGGQQDGTDPSATYGAGDGVMVAGDVRSYAREVCASGDPVDYPAVHRSQPRGDRSAVAGRNAAVADRAVRRCRGPAGLLDDRDGQLAGPGDQRQLSSKGMIPQPASPPRAGRHSTVRELRQRDRDASRAMEAANRSAAGHLGARGARSRKLGLRDASLTAAGRERRSRRDLRADERSGVGPDGRFHRRGPGRSRGLSCPHVAPAR